VIKFGRLNQKTGLVPVEFAADMTPEWFDQQESLLWEAQQTVARYLGTEGIGRPPA
jgi:hypothetical protein